MQKNSKDKTIELLDSRVRYLEQQRRVSYVDGLFHMFDFVRPFKPEPGETAQQFHERLTGQVLEEITKIKKSKLD